MANLQKFLVISGQGSWDDHDIIVEPADTTEEANDLHYDALRLGADDALIMKFDKEIGKAGGYEPAPEVVNWYGQREDPKKARKSEDEEPEKDEETEEE